MKNYRATAEKYKKSLNAKDKETFAFVPGPAQTRCIEKGLFQGRTPNPKEG